MPNENKINYDLIDKLYVQWRCERDPFIKRKLKDEIQNKISREDFLMYSIRFSLPFECFRNIFPLTTLFQTLNEMEKKGLDITNITNSPLVIKDIADIQALNQFSQNTEPTKVSNFHLKFQGNTLLNHGDLKKIGKKFPNACINFISIETIDQMLSNEKDYKGLPIIITIDNIGQLPLEKLANIEKKFDVRGLRIIEREREKNIKSHREQITPISLEDYKQIRTVVDNEILKKIYIIDDVTKDTQDFQLVIQILDLIAHRISYDDDFIKKRSQYSFEKYTDLSNIRGLITGKVVCGGCSEILRNVLCCVGVTSKTICGLTSDDYAHAWNQIKIGDVWFNLDLTWAIDNIRESQPSGDLFMSDKDFFGERRNATFKQDLHKNGNPIETKVLIGGHASSFVKTQKCDISFPPHAINVTREILKKLEEGYKRNGSSPDFKGAIPYVGSKAEKTRSQIIPVKPAQSTEIT